MKKTKKFKYFGLVISAITAFTFLSSAVHASATDTSSAAEIKGQYINVGGDVEMRYLVSVNDTNVSADDIKMKVNFHGTETEITESTAVNVGGIAYRMFAFGNIAPQAIGDNISAELYVNEKLTDSNNGYSVKQYLDTQYKTADAKLKKLIEDLLHYGAAAQTYKDYKTDSLVNKGFKVPDITVAESKFTKVDNSEKVDIYSANVKFSSVNYLMFKLKTSGDSSEIEGKVKLNGKAVSGIASDGYYTVISEPIAPYDFDTPVVLTYTGDDGDVELEYSINDYCYAMSKKASTDSMVSLAKALYSYGNSASDYMNSLTGKPPVDYNAVVSYEYDSLNRVVKVIYDDKNYIQYDYDSNGNITKVTVVENGIILQ